MIWTEGWLSAPHEGWMVSLDLSIDEHVLARWSILWRHRVELARAEADALWCRLNEERLVADTAIRALHMRLDRAEEIVWAARATTVDRPGSLAHTRAVDDLRAILAERDQHRKGQAADSRGAS